MPLTGTNRGTGGNTTAGTNITITPASNFSSSTMAVLAIAYDNSGGGGADPYSSITDSVGNTWTPRINVLNDPGAASAGSTLRIFTSNMTTALTTANTITVSFSSSTTAKSWTLSEIAAGTNFIVEYVTGASATGTSTTPTITSSSITSGNLILGAMGNEGNATITADSDTTNGTWSTQQTINNGTGTSGMQIASQYKVTTGTGTQTYNLTLSASGDWCIGWIEVREASLFTASDPFGQMGFFGL